MLLRGEQIHRRGQAKCSLFSNQSLPHDLARLYGWTLPFTSADLGGVAGPCLDELWIWTESHGQEIVHCTPSRRRDARLLHNQSPNAEGAVHLDCRDVGLMR